MLGYIIALVGLAIVAYILKVRMKISTLAFAFALFIIAGFLWATVADYFGLQPTDLVTNLLYSLVAFTIFWILWRKWGKTAE